MLNCCFVQFYLNFSNGATHRLKPSLYKQLNRLFKELSYAPHLGVGTERYNCVEEISWEPGPGKHSSYSP